MYWPLWRVQLKSFLCVACLKTSHSSLSARSHSHHVFDFCDQILTYYIVLCGSWFNPCWLCPHILRHRHTYWASAFLCYFNKAGNPYFEHCLCSLCAKTKISVLYHSWHSAECPCVSVVFFQDNSRLLSTSPLFWSVLVASTMHKL